jgi:uncharacterized protein YciI
MNQYVVSAYDYTDTGALTRRMNVRPFHLDGAKKLKQNGNYVLGGAMLNEDGEMIGSVMVLQFETTADLEAWKQNEPYIVQRIWESVDIKPFRVAAV